VQSQPTNIFKRKHIDGLESKMDAKEVSEEKTLWFLIQYLKLNFLNTLSQLTEKYQAT
jgi:hypothetical protein